MTGKLPDLHAGMLDRIVAAVRDDPRFDALLASGSLVSGGFDEQSDLDLILVARAEMQAAVMAECRSACVLATTRLVKVLAFMP